jgi:hypothetical protein
MAEDPKRLRATLVDAGWDTPAPPPVPPPPPVQRPARSGVMMTPIPQLPQSRPSARPPTVPPPPPAPSTLAPSPPAQVGPLPAPGLPPPSQRVEAPRDLPEYGIDGPASEATRVDRQMEARARAMNVLELASSINQIAGTRPAVGAHDAGLASDPHAREPLPGFRAAMLLRVRFAHGELPLWSLVTPFVILVALATAFAVAAVSTAPAAPEPPGGVADAANLAQPKAAPAAPLPSLTNAAAPSSAAAEPASSADLPSIESLSPKLRSTEVLEIASKHAGRQLDRARGLAAALDRDPSLAQDEKTQAEIRRLLDNQETSRHLLGVIAGLPGPVSADLLYEVWTGTVLRNETTDLARALLLSQDVRSKASPALSVSLALRQAERCEDNAKVLPRAIEHGDRRALHLLTKLTRRYGCGPNKREDCYPCLRSSDALDQAVKAVKNRREPKTFGRR